MKAKKELSRETPRIEKLRVKNYRALKELELSDLTPLSVFLGPNGSGKSTLFDVFAFLSECFSIGLRKAWDKRGRFKELRTRNSEGPIEFELKYREKTDSPIITYQLKINENQKGVFVESEKLLWRRKGSIGKPFAFLDFSKGKGTVISGEFPDSEDEKINESLDSPDMIAVNTLGQLSKNSRVIALRRFITSWYLSYLTTDHIRGIPEAGAQERLSATGDNLPNVMQYLKENHPDRLEKILNILSRRVPRLEKVEADIMQDGRLLLQIKDAPFDKPILSKFASDGTLKMLAYLIILYDPEPPQLIGIEEPENHLHPSLLPILAEECRASAEISQLMVTTHSPFFVNGLKSNELWILYRDNNGYTQAKRADQIKGIKEFMEEGAQLGQLWIEGHFGIGDPLVSEFSKNFKKVIR
ncbi:MAG: AAA family ATPase [Candidatus Kapabacteria bacterium]|nr:AAA family ATPase [Candidatus Kapabacteria bacterium]